METNYEIVAWDYANGGWQETIRCHTWRQAQKIMKKLSKKYFCVKLVVRTNGQGLI